MKSTNPAGGGRQAAVADRLRKQVLPLPSPPPHTHPSLVPSCTHDSQVLNEWQRLYVCVCACVRVCVCVCVCVQAKTRAVKEVREAIRDASAAGGGVSQTILRGHGAGPLPH